MSQSCDVKFKFEIDEIKFKVRVGGRSSKLKWAVACRQPSCELEAGAGRFTAFVGDFY
jgi:hypothetical protein